MGGVETRGGIYTKFGAKCYAKTVFTIYIGITPTIIAIEMVPTFVAHKSTLGFCSKI